QIICDEKDERITAMVRRALGYLVNQYDQLRAQILDCESSGAGLASRQRNEPAARDHTRHWSVSRQCARRHDRRRIDVQIGKGARCVARSCTEAELDRRQRTFGRHIEARRQLSAMAAGGWVALRDPLRAAPWREAAMAGEAARAAHF